MTGVNVSQAAPAGGAAPAAVSDTQTFLSGSGNYQIPAFAMADPTHYFLRIQAKGSGGPSGSGRRGAAGTVRCGGGPGGTGAFTDVRVSVADALALFPSGSIPYNVGTGGTGGAAVTADDTNGNAGVSDSFTDASTWLGASLGTSCLALARAGSAGAGGTASSGSGGASQPGTAPQPSSANASTTGGAGTAVTGVSGPGGGITSGDVPGAGAAGGSSIFTGGAPGSGGVVGGAAPTMGAAGITPLPWGGSGGGAASITAAAQAGAAGLANSGVGGGGGGASLNGFNSGAGAAGGTGALRVVCGP